MSFHLIVTTILVEGFIILIMQTRKLGLGLRKVKYCPRLPIHKEAVVESEPCLSQLTTKRVLYQCVPSTPIFFVNKIHSYLSWAFNHELVHPLPMEPAQQRTTGSTLLVFGIAFLKKYWVGHWFHERPLYSVVKWKFWISVKLSQADLFLFV